MSNFKLRNSWLIISTATLIVATVIKIFSPLIINNYSNEKKEERIISAINSTVEQKEKELEDFLLNVERKIKSDTESKPSKIPELITSLQNNNIEINLFANGKLLAWNREQIISYTTLQNKLKEQAATNVFFYETPLKVYLAKISVIGGFKTFVALPVEKKYLLRNPYFTKLSLVDSIANKFDVSIKISYGAGLEPGTFAIKNSAGITIGNVKLSGIDNAATIEKILKQRDFAVSLLLLLAALFFFIWFNKIIKRKYGAIKIGAFIFSVIAGRLLIAFTGVDNTSFLGGLTNPVYYSSQILWGFAKSPLALFFTLLSFFIVGLKIFTTFKTNFKTKYISFPGRLFALFLSLLGFLILYNLFSSILQSIIFDSSILYFKDATLFGGYQIIFMYFNILLIGISAVLFGVIFIELMYGIVKGMLYGINGKFLYIILFVVLMLFILLNELLSRKSSYVLSVFFLLIPFFITYFRDFTKLGVYSKILLTLFAGSVLSISFLNYFNTQLEIKSLKTIASELTRSNTALYEYYVQNTADILAKNNRLYTELSKNKNNMDAVAFAVWSNTPLPTEVQGSAVRIIDADKHLIGSFEYEFTEPFVWIWGDSVITRQKFKTIYESKSVQIISSVIPVITDSSVIGYVEINALHDANKIAINSMNKLINSSAPFKGIPVNTNLLKIYEYTNDTLTSYFTNVFLTKQEEEQIKDHSKHIKKEGWFELNIDNERHVFFLQNNGTQIIAVGLGEKDLMWNLFDFFKVFFVHSIMIFFFLIVVILLNYKKWKNFRISFRSKILVALLIVSIIPMILLAVYIKTISDERNRDAVNYQLGKRADNVERYIARYVRNSSTDLLKIFDNAATDLGINYSIYDDKNLIYSSEGTYYRIGLLPLLLNPDAYLAIKRYGIREVILDENVDDYPFNSLYHKSMLNNSGYIIKVSNLFNSFRLPMSGIELNVFLFGIYSLAIIIIIIISTILANQISAPIEKLTKATRSVSSGDMDIQLPEVGNSAEVKELIEGFNFMVRRLKKNQNELAEMERESAWREMAKQVAHEIKNPLTPMKLAIQHLVAAHKDKSAKYDAIFDKVTTTIIKQIDTLKNIASEFSNIAKMPALKLEKINVYKIINETADLFIEENCNIKVESKKEEILIESDREQFRRMIVNLIRNSIQADAKNIIITINESINLVEIFVRDDGKGISDEVVENIFDNEFTTKKEGMGLGLAMIKKFLNLTDGRIFVEATSVKGTTIKIEIKK